MRLVRLLIWLLVLLAAARPQWLELQRPLDMTARSSMLAFDLSASMLKEDLDTPDVSRFAATRQLVLQLLEQRPEDRFGLIFFSSEAFLQSPLTFDHISLHHWLDTASPGIAGDNTAIGDAIGLGIKKLRQLPATERNLILLTDGANNSGIMPPRTAARFAAREGIRIHAFAFRSLAMATGRPWRCCKKLPGSPADVLYVTDNTLEPLLQLLDSLPANLSARSTLQAQELYSWPLLGALLLAMLQAACLLWQGNPAIRHEAEP